MKMKSFLLISVIINISMSQIPTDGLIADFPFDGNATDVSGNGHDGTVNNAILTQDRFGKNNSAYSFDGTNRYITTDIGIQGTMSISLWYKAPVPTKYYPTMIHYSQSNNFEIIMDGNVEPPSQ